MTETIRAHTITAECQLHCLEDLLPHKPFRAVKRHLRDNEYFVHPIVGDVIDLYEQHGLTGIRGLGAQGVLIVSTFLVESELVTGPIDS